ncbi:aldehyde dehydrogenase family protein [Xylophilus rhododendri]|uniref:Aldehyde dehydrogenase family protein n=1 Tax=Xylophilus rhododendri TaxID=2697032 RepID=A0A857J682_9BURK|nr:aldehyde dehydrogenase [Xylophilus rhododendri]QHI98511.1 aldehyde dehydrogenase family protein [Xylophilus rhododendri]
MNADTSKPLLIGGEWLRSSAPPLVSVNPATGATNYEVHTATAEQVEQAVLSATQAAAQASWRGMQPPQRAAVLHRIGELMLRDAETFAELQRIENGKVHAECMVQVRSAAATFRYYASVCETLESALTPSRGNYLSMAVYEPYGVVVAITPWNSPMTMEAQKVAPALAAGNAVILKPSELTPSPALLLGRIALEAGLPPGLLNVLPGTGAAVGSALVAHAGVKMVSFTGGTASGRRIAVVAAQKLMPVALELGGKSPHIVFADADLDAAADAVAGGIFEGSGQSCVAGSRLFVQRSVYEAFIEKLLAKARGLKVGLPDRPESKMGPIASFAHRQHIAGMVDAARAAGAEVLTGGGAPEDEALSAGAFYLPTVVAGISNRSDIAQNEIFGPVVCAMVFDDEDDLIAQANDSVFGLASGIWTRDFPRAWRVARALEAGTVWINTYKQLSIATPFGGFKDSGLGREKGTGGMRLYQQAKGIYFGLGG